ncbi:hypothetical protein [Bordetella sp. 02P26C-1]|uniref:hypothetical protein n=1 Tax=Bordetella sp. 02P26C-1 TaxID=2683195 RepID=UPI0013547FDF|nr:hypothetical protein [Bordetella sp. 02P26C-1]MVW78076.1 hypothetical protein [Bordetella sp. 02P26C-1]
MQKKSDFDSLYPTRTGFFYILWIMCLLIAPLFGAGYLGEKLKWLGDDIGPALAFGLLLPVAYLLIYVILRKLEAESRSFIIFVILLFLVVGLSELWKATRTGDQHHWVKAAVALAYLAVYGLVYRYLNRRHID